MKCFPQRVTLDRLIQRHVPTARSLRPIIAARRSNPRPIIATRRSEAKPVIAIRRSELKTYHSSPSVNQNLSLQPGGPLKIYHGSPEDESKSPKPVMLARRSEAKPVILD